MKYQKDMHVNVTIMADKKAKIITKKGQVVDGRNAFMEKEILKQARNFYKKHGHIPRKFELAFSVWQVFKDKCNLVDEKTGKQKYYLPHAEAKANRLIDRVNEGLVNIGQLNGGSSGGSQTKT
tara:strand:+ start:9819 stop:10187 length:369 start_codon:yes stop_codon:yes gene_type:complete